LSPNTPHSAAAVGGVAVVAAGDARVAAERPAAVAGKLLAHNRVASALSIVVGLTIWQIAAGQVSDFILPSPLAVLERFADPAWLTRLLRALSDSLIQLGLGFALSLGTAVPLGIVIGRSTTLTRMFEPVINALYAIPPVAFVPFLIIWFGLFLEARVALVFLMSFFDILVVVIAGARDVRRPLIDVGQSFGASHAQRLRLIVLPALLPFFFAALRVGSARAINGMITAELFFAAVNLGALMKRASQNFDSAAVLSVVVLICLLGLIAQSLINMLESRVLHWHVRT
jgi:ABC-type nitrate/sulfonate/bicarbonate transport system permease component